ncbi:hypothetical protein HDU79_001261 [Rhizoclosmatium sp. JEL0117]|nr:hypothetical protein HDU79_001261 [Rhizoclosmatium sp. JEL0117]
MSATDTITIEPSETVQNLFQTSSSIPTQRRVAITVDESKFSEYAVTWAIKNYLQETDIVLLVHVRTPASEPLSLRTTDYSKKVMDGFVQISKDLLSGYMDILAEHEFRSRGISLAGKVKQTIVSYMNEVKPDVLLMGSRGPTLSRSLTKTLMPRTSDYCSTHCSCSVVVVKPTPEELLVLEEAEQESMNRGDSLKLASRVGLM